MEFTPDFPGQNLSLTVLHLLLWNLRSSTTIQASVPAGHRQTKNLSQIADPISVSVNTQIWSSSQLCVRVCVSTSCIRSGVTNLVSSSQRASLARPVWKTDAEGYLNSYWLTVQDRQQLDSKIIRVQLLNGLLVCRSVNFLLAWSADWRRSEAAVVDIWWIKSQLTASALIGLFFGWTCGCCNKSLVGLFKTLKTHFYSGTFKAFMISFPITEI